MSTKAVLVRKNRQTFRAHKPKAPSGRELPTKSGEGERVTMKFNLRPHRAKEKELKKRRNCGIIEA